VAFAYRRCEFRKATRSEPPDKSCVHIARGYGLVVIRDTKQEWGSENDHHIVMPAEAFDKAQTALRSAGVLEADVPARVLEHSELRLVRLGADRNVMSSTLPRDIELPRSLEFTDAEIVAWLHGIHNREFDLETTRRIHNTQCLCQGASLTIAA